MFANNVKVNARTLYLLVPLGCVLVVAGVWVGVLLLGDSQYVDTPAESPVEYASKQGGFTARFPRAPLESQQDFATADGTRTIYRATCVNENVTREVSYFDLAIKEEKADFWYIYNFDPKAGLEEAARRSNCSVLAQQETWIQGGLAYYGKIGNEKGARGEIAMMRVRNRVFLVMCQSTVAGVDLKFDEFLRGFKLGEQWAPAPPLVISGPVEARAEINEEFSISFSVKGGVAPYEWQCDEMPSGLRGESNSNEYRLLGRPDTAWLHRLVVKVLDKRGDTAALDLELKVIRPPTEAGTIYVRDLNVRTGADFWTDVRLEAPYEPVVCVWTFNEKELPPGLKCTKVDSNLSISGVPTMVGKFQVVFTCEVQFNEFPGRTFSASASKEFVVAKARSGPPELAPLLGESTLFIIDSGPYAPGPLQVVLPALESTIEKQSQKTLVNVWTWGSREGKWLSLAAGNKPVNAGKSCTLLEKLPDLDVSGSGGALRLELKSIAAGELDAYDSLVIITPFRDAHRLDELALAQAQLLNLVKDKPKRLTLIVVSMELPKELESWASEHKIGLIHQVP